MARCAACLCTASADVWWLLQEEMTLSEAQVTAGVESFTISQLTAAPDELRPAARIDRVGRLARFRNEQTGDVRDGLCVGVSEADDLQIIFRGCEQPETMSACDDIVWGFFPPCEVLAETVLAEIIAEETAWPYMEPVDVEGLGLVDYAAVVSHPMDLGTIGYKLMNGEYPRSGAGELDLELFAADMRLVFDNAMAYNWEGSEFHEWAKKLKKLFNRCPIASAVCCMLTTIAGGWMN